MSYHPHELLLQEARAKSELWRFALGLVLVIVVWFAFGLLSDQFLLPVLLAATGKVDFINGTNPVGMAVLLGSFLYAILAVGLVVQGLHARGLGSVIGPKARVIWQGTRVLRILAVLVAVLIILPPYSMGAPLGRNLDLARWLMWLPLSLALVLVQVSAEEILFRGYLQQGLAARFKSPLVWMVLPSALFGMGHYMPRPRREKMPG